MLRCLSVKVDFGGEAVLRAIDLEIPEAEIYMIFGNAGSGKSTLLQVLAGWLDPSGGSVELNGLSMDKWPSKALAARCAYVSQAAELDMNLSAREVASLNQTRTHPQCVRRSPVPAVNKSLEVMAIAPIADRAYHSLSFSEKRRVQIARALAQTYAATASDRFLLLDEPQMGLDCRQQRHLPWQLRGLSQSGVTVIAAIGDTAFASVFEGYMFLLESGRIVLRGVSQDCLTPNFVARTVGTANRHFETDSETHL